MNFGRNLTEFWSLRDSNDSIAHRILQAWTRQRVRREVVRTANEKLQKASDAVEKAKSGQVQSFHISRAPFFLAKVQLVKPAARLRGELDARVDPASLRERAGRGRPRAAFKRRNRSSIGTCGHDTSLFSKLVLGYIETKFCNQIRILQQFSKSTKLLLSSC